MKFIVTLVSALFLSTAAMACTFPLTKAQEYVTENSAARLAKLDKTQTDKIVEKAGPPPVEGEYELHVLDSDTGGSVLVVQDGCITTKIGPVPREALDTLLGIVKANNKDQ